MATLSGTELITVQNDRDFESNSVGDWSNYSGGVCSVNSATPIDGSYSLLVTVTGSGGARLSMAGMTGAAWYRISCKAKVVSGLPTIKLDDIGAGNTNSATAIAMRGSGCYTAGDNRWYLVDFGSPFVASFDTFSVQSIVQSSMFSQMRNSGSSVVAEASVATTLDAALASLSAMAPLGVVICANDITTPTKYILGTFRYNSGGSRRATIYAVNGTSVTVYEAGTAAYVSGGIVKLTKDGSDSVKLYYDGNLLVTQTIAGYADTNHGLFNTDNGNTLGAYTLPAAAPTGKTVNGVICNAVNGVGFSAMNGVS